MSRAKTTVDNGIKYSTQIEATDTHAIDEPDKIAEEKLYAAIITEARLNIKKIANKKFKEQSWELQLEENREYGIRLKTFITMGLDGLKHNLGITYLKNILTVRDGRGFGHEIGGAMAKIFRVDREHMGVIAGHTPQWLLNSVRFVVKHSHTAEKFLQNNSQTTYDTAMLRPNERNIIITGFEAYTLIDATNFMLHNTTFGAVYPNISLIQSTVAKDQPLVSIPPPCLIAEMNFFYKLLHQCSDEISGLVGKNTNNEFQTEYLEIIRSFIVKIRFNNYIDNKENIEEALTTLRQQIPPPTNHKGEVINEEEFIQQRRVDIEKFYSTCSAASPHAVPNQSDNDEHRAVSHHYRQRSPSNSTASSTASLYSHSSPHIEDERWSQREKTRHQGPSLNSFTSPSVGSNHASTSNREKEHEIGISSLSTQTNLGDSPVTTVGSTSVVTPTTTVATKADSPASAVKLSEIPANSSYSSSASSSSNNKSHSAKHKDGLKPKGLIGI